jgi:hypothetical protein
MEKDIDDGLAELELLGKLMVGLKPSHRSLNDRSPMMFLKDFSSAASQSFAQCSSIAFCCVVGTLVIYSRVFHPVRKVPGPFFALVTRGWMACQVIRGDMEHTQRALHAKHGLLTTMTRCTELF